MLELCDIHTSYGESEVLRGVSMTVGKDSIVALIGRNGMGKTTTLHSIIGFTPPSKGQIFFDGKNIAGMPAYQIVRRGIALVPQGRRIFPSLTVKENLTLGYRKHGKSKGRFDLNNIYELFPVLEKKGNLNGHHLSGGEQQMLAVARSLLTQPDLLLMDEPFEGLAPMVINDLRQKFYKMKTTGLTILIVEQNLNEVLKIADTVYVIHKGKIVYGGTPENLFNDSEIIKRYIEI